MRASSVWDIFACLLAFGKHEWRLTKVNDRIIVRTLKKATLRELDCIEFILWALGIARMRLCFVARKTKQAITIAALANMRHCAAQRKRVANAIRTAWLWTFARVKELTILAHKSVRTHAFVFARTHVDALGAADAWFVLTCDERAAACRWTIDFACWTILYVWC